MPRKSRHRRPVPNMSEGNFVGARLELSRAFRQVTLKKLAEEVSVSFGLLGHYENGRRKRPGEDLVGALALALEVKPGFFFEPLADVWKEHECSFRRRVATPEGVKKRARAHGTMIGLVVRELSEYVKPKRYNVPSISAASPDEINEAANRCRVHWKLGKGPIPHVGRLAEQNGVILVQHLVHADKIDAFARRGSVSVILLNKARASTSRWIFDVAHELGHFVMHEGKETGSKDTEDQANCFAGALLLPRATFGQEFRSRPFSWTHIFDLKRRWFASAGAIIRRAYNLGLLDPISYRRCYRYMSMRGWIKSEPSEPPFVGPEWLQSAFAVAAEDYQVTAMELCDKLNFTPDLFTSVTGVPIEHARPVPFRPRLVTG